MSFPIRSPRHLTGGIVILARVIDKIRLHAAGQLPEGYHVGFMEGNRTFDDRLCRFLQVDFDALTSRTLAGGSDEEILEWCFANGHRPEAEQIEVWNGFLQKRGWRDNGSPGLIQQKAEAGFAGREDIATWFDLIEAEEGHTPSA
jgi:gluconokinase